MNHIIVLILMLAIESLSYAKVRPRVELSLFGNATTGGGSDKFTLSRKNVIDLSGSEPDQIARVFPLEKISVFQARNKYAVPLTLKNIGYKDVKFIIQNLRRRSGLAASKVSLVIDLNDISYLSEIHHLIRKNRLGDLYILLKSDSGRGFDQNFWRDFETFALLTQSVRRYVLLPDFIDIQMKSKMKKIFLQSESVRIKKLKKSIRSMQVALESEKKKTKKESLDFLKKKNHLPADYQFSDSQLKAVLRPQNELNETICSVNELSSDIRRCLILLKKEIALKKIELSYNPLYRDIVKMYDDIPDLSFTLPHLTLPKNYSAFTKKIESLEGELKDLSEFYRLLDSFYLTTETFKNVFYDDL